MSGARRSLFAQQMQLLTACRQISALSSPTHAVEDFNLILNESWRFGRVLKIEVRE